MTRKKTKKKKSSAPFGIFRHPLLAVGPLSYVRLKIALLGVVCLAGAICASAPARGAQNPGGAHARDFLIFVTVFTDRGFAFPGAKARVRRADEQKFKWEAMSDRRGEFGIRVPKGAEYEMTIEARGFKPETRKIDARDSGQADLTIHMEALPGGKS